MYAAHPNHGQTVRFKATSVRLVMIGVVRCISGPAASSLSESIAPPRRRVLRTRILPARPLLDQVLSSATSHVAMVTTVTLAQLCSSVLSYPLADMRIGVSVDCCQRLTFICAVT